MRGQSVERDPFSTNNNNKEHDHSTKKWPQIVAALAATLGSFGCGTGIAWSSPVLPNVNSAECGDNCDIPGVSSGLASWIGPLFALGAFVAGPFAFYLINKIGRKWTLIAFSVPMFVGYVLLTVSYFLESISVLLTGRFLTGFSGGAYALVAPLYVSEMAEKSVRGSLASLMQLMSCLGVAFVDGLNIYGFVDWPYISAICTAIPVLLAAWLVFMPESPMYLVGINRLDEAKNSLQWFRGPRADIGIELKAMQAAKEDQDRAGSITLKELFCNALYRRPFAIALFAMFGQQFSGINVVFFYLKTIFEKAGSALEAGLSAFLVAMCQVVGTLLAVLIVDKLGRRVLLILSDLVMCVSILTLGIYFYLDEGKETTVCHLQTSTTVGSIGIVNNDTSDCFLVDGYDPETLKNLGWLPLASLMIYVVAFAIGFGPLAWTLNAELFAPEAKSLCASIAFCFNWLSCFVVTKFEPDVESIINASGAYFLFAAICGLGTIVVYFFVPETKGKTSEEIKEYFWHKANNKTRWCESNVN